MRYGLEYDSNQLTMMVVAQLSWYGRWYAIEREYEEYGHVDLIRCLPVISMNH